MWLKKGKHEEAWHVPKLTVRTHPPPPPSFPFPFDSHHPLKLHASTCANNAFIAAFFWVLCHLIFPFMPNRQFTLGGLVALRPFTSNTHIKQRRCQATKGDAPVWIRPHLTHAGSSKWLFLCWDKDKDRHKFASQQGVDPNTSPTITRYIHPRHDDMLDVIKRPKKRNGKCWLLRHRAQRNNRTVGYIKLSVFSIDRIPSGTVVQCTCGALTVRG